ncbi:MAG: threonine/serine exporter family protein [Oscillospiraceae bacterium]|nr:threonine/serine exporter family protein [Oscillospiraceae bacterium]
MSKFRDQHMTIKWWDIIDSESTQPILNASLREKSLLVGRVGLMMLSVGTGAWRVRASMNKIARGLGITCVADIGLLSISYTCAANGETFTNSLSLKEPGVNTDKLDAIEFFCDSFRDRAGKYSEEQMHHILDKIDSMSGNYNAVILGLASGMACAAFTFLLGGGAVEMLCAFLGAGVGNFLRKKLLENHITLLANVALPVTAACLVYFLAVHLMEMIFGVPMVHQSGYICSMLFVIPGFPLITGGIDISKLDLRSGAERIGYALLIIITATVTGWLSAYIMRFEPGDFPEIAMSPAMRVVFRMIASFVGVFGFSLMFNSPKRMALSAGVIGMISNTLRLTLADHLGIPGFTAAFIGALCSGLLASASKKFVGFPRITLTVPSIVIMVPGMFMYKAIYYLSLNDLSVGGAWLTKAFLMVLSLPLGLIVARIITDKNFRRDS